MEIQENFVNKVAQSGLMSFDLADLRYPGERIVYDIKDNLFHGLMLREKDFRAFIKEHNWQQYRGKSVAIICSADAIVPTWAYMLLAVQFSQVADHFIFGDLEALENGLYLKALNNLSLENFKNERVVIKGCGDLYVPVTAYVEITGKLTGIAKSIMYGEPCSTVPIYKRKD